MKFKLFANCILVKGAKYYSICDLQRNELYSLESKIASMFNEDSFIEVENFDPSKQSTMLTDKQKVVRDLLEQDLIYNFEDFSNFPSIDTQWDEPYHITNGIVDVISLDFLSSCIESFSQIGCPVLQIRCFVVVHISDLKEVFSDGQIGSIPVVELILQWYEGFNHEMLVDLCMLFNNISCITVYGSPSDKTYSPINYDFGRVIYTKAVVNDERSCGYISVGFFTVNMKTYTESHHHNSCLNRKVSVDRWGNIKNCPSMKESFGNISDTTLAEAIEKPGFKKYWDINKDKIHVCKDCEFRYVCTDCRAYVEDPEDILSKPLKCGYNPYTGEWSEWSTNPLKQKAIEFYGMTDMIANSNRQEEKKV